jgi:hypothetical protein
VAGLVTALLALRHGRVALIARAGFARHVPKRVDSVPVAAIAALIELGIDPRAFSDLRRRDTRLAAWSSELPGTLNSPGTVHVERGGLEAALFALVLRHPRLTLLPAPRRRADLRSLIERHARSGATLLDATGRTSLLATRRTPAPSQWHGWTQLWQANAGRPFDDGFRIAAVADGYCYRLGTRHRLTLGVVSFAGGPSEWRSERLRAHRRELPWLFEGLPDTDVVPTDRVYPAGVQWSSHENVLAVGDACFARDALSSQGLAALISQAHYAVAVESPEDGALYAARAREQRLCHLRSLLGLLSDSRYATEAHWQRYREFVARGLGSPADAEAPVVVLRRGRLGVAAGGPALSG